MSAAGSSWRGWASQGMASPGADRQVRCGLAWKVPAGQGVAGKVRRGTARPVEARLGKAAPARSGLAWLVPSWRGRRGLGMARQRWFRQGSAGCGRQGMAGRRRVWRGMVRQVRFGPASLGTARPVMAGEVWHGVAERGLAGQGTSLLGCGWHTHGVRVSGAHGHTVRCAKRKPSVAAEGLVESR